MSDYVKVDKSEVKNLVIIKQYNLDTRYLCDKKGNVYLIKAITPRYYVCKQMKPFRTRDGYLEYVLTTKGGSKKHIQAHRIVANLYLPLVKGADYVNHKDGKRDNNELSNLEWVNQRENILHSYRTLGRQGWRRK